MLRDTLTDGVLTLHRYQAGDAEDVYSAALESRQEIYPWLPWCGPDYQISEAHAWIASQIAIWNEAASFEFCIRTVDGQHVGGGGINGLNADHPFANLGYWVRTHQTRKGYATRATRLLAQFALTDLKLQRVEIVAAVGNVASQRVAEKSGATREGVLRHRLVLHDIPHDAAMFSFTSQDLENLGKAIHAS